MKALIFVSAVALGTAAVAADKDYTADATPDTLETSVYDGPDSYTPSQPPPDGSVEKLESTAMADFKPIARASYPICSEAVRDNCVQAIDPGGSEVELAQAQGTVFESDVKLAQAKLATDAEIGMGGPEGEVDESEYQPQTHAVMSQSFEGYTPIIRDSYPLCSATITDNCQQR